VNSPSDHAVFESLGDAVVVGRHAQAAMRIPDRCGWISMASTGTSGVTSDRQCWMPLTTKTTTVRDGNLKACAQHQINSIQSAPVDTHNNARLDAAPNRPSFDELLSFISFDPDIPFEWHQRLVQENPQMYAGALRAMSSINRAPDAATRSDLQE
jgi:hypothetical protein